MIANKKVWDKHGQDFKKQVVVVSQQPTLFVNENAKF